MELGSSFSLPKAANARPLDPFHVTSFVYIRFAGDIILLIWIYIHFTFYILCSDFDGYVHTITVRDSCNLSESHQIKSPN